MTAQKGKDLLLKVDTNGAGSFVTVAGLRARTLAFNAATVDVTDTELVGRWRELLDGAGVKTAHHRQRHLQGCEHRRDGAPVFLRRPGRNWQVIVPELGAVEGPFRRRGLGYAGQRDGEVKFRTSS